MPKKPEIIAEVSTKLTCKKCGTFSDVPLRLSLDYSNVWYEGDSPAVRLSTTCPGCNTEAFTTRESYVNENEPINLLTNFGGYNIDG